MPPLSRRRFCASLAASTAASNAQSTRSPNIVFVLTDDQGYGDIACHGNPIIKTPNLDRLHGESVRFTDYHVSPTCSPTRTALLTGKHEFKSGVTHTIMERERMSLKSTTFAQVLKSGGYTTGIFGKWHMGDDEPHQPTHRGFDEVFIHGCGGIGQDSPGTCSDAPGNTYFNPTIRHNGVFERTQGYCTDVFFTQALKWIEERGKSETPFFAYITPNAPHDPLICPEEYQRMYRGTNLPEETQKYFGMITNIDDNVGRLMSRLTDWGLDRNTILIFMTDNGSISGVRVFNAGMRGAKATPWQGGTRVPAFFRFQGVWQPGDRDHLTANIDIFPTLAQLTGAKIPEGLALDGRSIVPLLKDAHASWPDRVVFTHVGRWPHGQAPAAKYTNCSMRNTRYSMVNTRPAKQWQLFDIKADPGETTNTAAQHPDVVNALDAAYDKWWESILPCLENEDAVPPQVAPYKLLYWKQYGGGPGVIR
jgi:arylsulfatase A-like enzyme